MMVRFRRILEKEPEETTRHPDGSILTRPVSLIILALFLFAIAYLIFEVLTV